jgi:hypothetical protein
MHVLAQGDVHVREISEVRRGRGEGSGGRGGGERGEQEGERW